MKYADPEPEQKMKFSNIDGNQPLLISFPEKIMEIKILNLKD